MKQIYENKNKILNYIGSDYSKCLYLYLNIMKYCFNNKNIKVWIEETNGECNCVILKYYTGMHIYSKDNNFNINDVITLIEKEKPSVICAEKYIIKKIENILDKNIYSVEYGWVRSLNKKFEYENDEVQIAGLSDLYESAELIIKDSDISNTYTLDSLYNQIKERNVEKYGRNYIIKDNRKIIAHASTSAESDKVAVLSYVMTDEKYRGKKYATKVCSKLCNDLIIEGKTVYLINYTNESTGLYDKLGFKISCEWGKLYKIEKEEGR